MGKYIVMDIVFYGNSLNYDQGSGNYQELKKITKWDGRQYTLVSRYALRYSLLETARKASLWSLAEEKNLTASGSGDKKVIQPAVDFLLSGELLEYPEFDLFGYLITDPQNFRTAPVKIDHAVSMTPFNYDALFNANLGLANRMRKKFGDMKPNPFTSEEHETFYQYSVVIDIENIGETEVYIKKDSEINFKNEKWKIEDIEDGEKIIFKLKKGKKQDEIIQSDNIEKLELINPNDDLTIIKYGLKKNSNDSVEKRIYQLIKTILNLKRGIKGREEDLTPKVMILGIYEDNFYKTYKDKITLLDEYVEEEYDEIEESKLENGGKIVKVRHKTTKSRKPTFEINGVNSAPELIDEKRIFECINHLFRDKTNSQEEASEKEGKITHDEESIQKECEEVTVFYDPSIEVEIKNSKEK
ncbi:MAG: type I-B CRISPR-associated protein Cas7/Cst2/DevR [Methanobacterium sp.]|jgi:CRISPR-associated protein Cst2